MKKEGSILKKKFPAFISIALVLSMMVTACSGGKSTSTSAASQSASTAATSSASTDKYLNVSMSEDENPDTLDVQKTSNYYGVPLNIFDRLVECKKVNGETKIEPSLADSWNISKDGLVYTFSLHKGVKFSNGEELTANDVIYTINRMMNPATKSENTDVFDVIKGASDVYNGKAKTVSGVKAKSKYTVEITLEKAFAPFLADLTVPGASIYNKKACEAAGTKFGIDPASTIGTGPFIVKSWTLNSEIVMVKNPNYFKGNAKLDGVRFKVIKDANTAKMSFENGSLDVLDLAGSQSQVPYFKQSSKWKNNVVSGPIAGVYYYLFNESVKPLDNVKVRKAIEMAIDRKAILDSLYNGEGKVINSIIPEGVSGYNKDAPAIKFDVKAAKQLLTEAGYPNGFNLEIDQSNDNSDATQMNPVIQSELAQIGIKVKIVQMDSATFLSKRKTGNIISMYEGDWSADYDDQDNFLYTFFASKNVNIRSINYANSSIISDVEKARTMTDADARTKLYQTAEKTIVNDDAAFFPLFQLNHIFVVSNRVSNFKVSWNGWSSMSYYEISMK